MKQPMKYFKCLNKWRIHYKDDGENYACESHDAKARRATIYPYHEEKAPPEDYLFHEQLHIAIAHLHACGPEDKETEERLVDELCLYARPYLKGVRLV